MIDRLVRLAGPWHAWNTKKFWKMLTVLLWSNALEPLLLSQIRNIPGEAELDETFTSAVVL